MHDDNDVQNENKQKYKRKVVVKNNFVENVKKKKDWERKCDRKVK